MIALIVAAGLFVAGIALSAIGVVFMGNNSHFISKNNYKSVTADVTEDFKSISVLATTCDVIFEASPDNNTLISAHVPEKSDVESFVEDGTLHIRVKDNRKWYDFIRISIGTESPSVVVYLPKGEYETLYAHVTTGDFSIGEEHSFSSLSFEASTGDAVILSPVGESLYAKVTTGDVRVGNTSPALMELRATTGDIKIENVQNSGKITAKTGSGKVSFSTVHANEIDIETTTGDIGLEDVIAASSAHIKATSGDVEFEAFDSAEIYIKVTTGDVEGELLSSKKFITDTTTGDVRVPYSTEGGVCDIKTTTGDIEIYVVDRSSRIYVWEKEGAGGAFTISLFEDGTFQYYEGMFSSYIGMGTWEKDGEVITLTEGDIGYGFVFKFRMSHGDLLFIKEESDKFLYTDVADGDRFLGRMMKEDK